ncbi:alanine racemase [Sneathiella chinensis]|uniref:Alanine racemase n=1 Tax=Sneathiella chinensis TaxID=349750 RepID=A0ABQ5U8R6_9PROT|nr:alanine racemase [Sneathiella chinensis]GLQ07585.1 alanine racemase [Sneathiella chinensis]
MMALAHEPRLAGGYLTIDLGALRANYRTLQEKLGDTECAGVVKADAYGLGIERVAPALAEEGCRKFFVALPEEGVTLRRLLPDVEIFILSGLFQDCEELYVRDRLAPCLTSLEEIRRWSAAASRHGPLPCILHLDSGISRLGLMEGPLRELAENPDWLDGLEVEYLMSHLACADSPENSYNEFQLEKLNTAISLLPPALRDTPVSFANSSGIFLGPEFQRDLARPGVALYGGNPTPGKPSPVRPVIHLQGKILQVHDVDSNIAVGYGASYRTAKNGRIATVSVGYADGYFRAFGNSAFCAIQNRKIPVVGRVSMDMLTIDVTDVEPELCKPGELVSLIGGAIDIDELADKAGTISYELLTSLGHRYYRRYID